MHVLHTEFTVAIAVCRESIPARFWQFLHERIVSFAQDRKNIIMLERVKAVCQDVPPNAKGLKLLSHFGAVKAHSGIHRSFVQKYGTSRQGYFDPGNAVYTAVLKKLWPDCALWRWMTNQATIGDLLEAFLGLCWCMEQKRLHVARRRAFSLRDKVNSESTHIYIYTCMHMFVNMYRFAT